MKQLLLAFIALPFCSAHSQQNALTGNVATITTYTIHGLPAESALANLKSGSPYFKDEWLNSTIILKDGQQYENVQAKVNLYENKIHYMSNNIELVAESPIRDVVLTDALSNDTYHFVNYPAVSRTGNDGEAKWYLSLLEGAVSLYKLYDKAIEESRAYNSAIVDRSMNTKESYFVFYKGELRPVRKLRELPEIFFDKQSEMNAFVKQQPKKPFEQSLKEAVAYYNSIRS
jgi:hypothetical protein